jgi:5-oxoprolinase (ATP-hydrolysing)
MKRLGVDVGGTHTDLVLVDDETGRITLAKLPSTPQDPSIGTLTGVQELCATAGIGLGEVEYFIHGTTVATNIILEHNGASVGMLTTEGFRDIIHIARHKRPYNFSLQQDLPWQKHALVKRRHRMTVRERIAAPRGEVLKELDEDEVRERVRALKAEGVEAVAVCLLFSFLNPAHEARIATIVREEFPSAYLSVSHEVIPQYREYERFTTTCLNAYIGPKTARYLDNLDRALKEQGLTSELHLMQSAGGSATLQGAVARPVTLLMSGPVAGLIGGIWVGELAGYGNVITLDVGGTSADIGVAPQGEMRMKHLLDTRIGDYQAMVPMADVDTIGAGGGSIAYVDAGGVFRVGTAQRRRVPGAQPATARRHRAGFDRRPGRARAREPRQLSRRTHAPRRGASPRGDRDASVPEAQGGSRGGRLRRSQDPHPRHGAGDRTQQRAQGVRPPRLRACGLRRRRSALRLRHRPGARNPYGRDPAQSWAHQRTGPARHRHRLRFQPHRAGESLAP